MISSYTSAFAKLYENPQNRRLTPHGYPSACVWERPKRRGCGWPDSGSNRTSEIPPPATWCPCRSNPGRHRKRLHPRKVTLRRFRRCSGSTASHRGAETPLVSRSPDPSLSSRRPGHGREVRCCCLSCRIQRVVGQSTPTRQRSPARCWDAGEPRVCTDRSEKSQQRRGSQRWRQVLLSRVFPDSTCTGPGSAAIVDLRDLVQSHKRRRQFLMSVTRWADRNQQRPRAARS